MTDVMDLPKTYGEAKSLGARHYFTGKPCKRGHIDVRFVSNGKCAECLREDCRAYHIRHREKLIADMRQYAKNDPAANARRSRQWLADASTEQLENLRARVAKWKRGNADRVRLHNENRRALKVASGTKITIDEWLQLKVQHGNRCLCCGAAEPEVVLAQDHIIPLAHGGIHHISNIQPLCGLCNSRKGVLHTDYRSEAKDADAHLG